jgi:hypothetical protein
MWANDEIIKSSTWKELKAVEITLKKGVLIFSIANLSSFLPIIKM